MPPGSSLSARIAPPAAPAPTSGAGEPPGAALGASQRRLLEVLKRRGSATLLEVSAALALSRETVREHLNALAAGALVARNGTRRGGRGRPEILYRLTRRAESLFPQRDGAVLGELAAWLRSHGGDAMLKRFFEERAGRRRDEAMRRVAKLKGRRRLEEVARILSEEGYMAEVEGGALRLCHCPIAQAVAVTRAPCRAELAFVESLLGRPLTRTDYLPDGGASCTYRVGSARGGRR